MSTTSANPNNITISMFPREIIILIFQYLSRVDIGKAARTCKSWLKYSKDSSLRWAILWSLDVVEQHTMDGDPIYSGFPPQQQRIKKRKLLAAEGKVPFALKKDTNWTMCMVAENGDTIFQVNTFTFMGFMTPIADIPVKDPSFIKWEIEPLPRERQQEAFQMYWGVRPSDADLAYPCAWRARLMVNFHKVEQAVKQNLPRPWEAWLIDTFVSHIYTDYSLDKMPFDYRAVHTPLERRGEELEQPAGFAEGLTLHPYQLAAVRWMKTIETEIEKGFDYTTFAVWRSARSDLLIDLQQKKLVTAEAAQTRQYSFRLNGGILADEMGLGKTIELCGLMLSNPAPKDFLVRKSDGLMPTKATLVFCPNHLAKQWIEELKARAPALRAILIATIIDRRAHTVASFREADVVVVTYNFLQNNNYNLDKKKPAEQISRIEGLKKQMKNSSSVGMKSQPFIEQFLWHRIILDEAHDALAADLILREILFRIEGRYKWYVSGTPFATGLLVSMARSWLSQDPVYAIEYHSSDPAERHYQQWIECDLMLNNLYWRNTKASVKADWSIPNLKYQTLMLDFQPIEKLLYDDMAFQNAGYSEVLLQMCNGDMLYGANLNSLIDRLKAEFAARITNCKSQIAEYKRLIEKDLYPNHTETYKVALEQQQKLLDHTEKLLPRLQAINRWIPPTPASPVKNNKRAAEDQEKKEEVNDDEEEEEPAAKGRGKMKGTVKKAPAKKAKTGGNKEPATPAPKGGKRAKKQEEPAEKKETEREEEEAPEEQKRKTRGRAAPQRKAAAAAKAALPAAVFRADDDAEAREGQANNAPKSLEVLVQELGTKLANVLSWLQDLLKNNKSARVILFSAVSPSRRKSFA